MEIIEKISLFGGLSVKEPYLYHSSCLQIPFHRRFVLFVNKAYLRFFSDIRKETKVRTVLKVWLASFLTFILGIYILTPR